MPTWVTNGLGLNFYFGGTSLLIVVGVAMDTVQQVEAQLIMRHYDGFSPEVRPHPRPPQLVVVGSRASCSTQVPRSGVSDLGFY